MYYFDNNYLLQYLQTGAELKVFVDQEYYVISSADDVLDKDTGHGYDIYGEHHEFDYRMIDHILVNGLPFTLDQLQDSIEGGDEEEGEEPEGEAEEKEEDDGKKTEPPKDDEEKKEESIQTGDYVRNIDVTHRKFGTKGSVVLSENGYVVYKYYDSRSSNRFTKVQVKTNQLEKC